MDYLSSSRTLTRASSKNQLEGEKRGAKGNSNFTSQTSLIFEREREREERTTQAIGQHFEIRQCETTESRKTTVQYPCNIAEVSTVQTDL